MLSVRIFRRCVVGHECFFKCWAIELVSERCIVRLLDRVVEVKPTYILLLSEIQSPKGHLNLYITLVETYNAPFWHKFNSSGFKKNIHAQQHNDEKFSPTTQQYLNIKMINKNFRFSKHYILETCNQHLIESIFKPVLMYLNVFSYWHYLQNYI